MTKEEQIAKQAIESYLSKRGRIAGRAQKKKVTKKQLSEWGRKGMAKRWKDKTKKHSS
jgi:hypothetical protein